MIVRRKVFAFILYIIHGFLTGRISFFACENAKIKKFFENNKKF